MQNNWIDYFIYFCNDQAIIIFSFKWNFFHYERPMMSVMFNSLWAPQYLINIPLLCFIP